MDGLYQHNVNHGVRFWLATLLSKCRRSLATGTLVLLYMALSCMLGSVRHPVFHLHVILIIRCYFRLSACVYASGPAHVARPCRRVLSWFHDVYYPRSHGVRRFSQAFQALSASELAWMGIYYCGMWRSGRAKGGQ